MNPIQTAPSLIWVHIVYNIGNLRNISRFEEQVTKVVTGRLRVNREYMTTLEAHFKSLKCHLKFAADDFFKF